jgi:hypothetical protein
MDVSMTRSNISSSRGSDVTTAKSGANWISFMSIFSIAMGIVRYSKKFRVNMTENG